MVAGDVSRGERSPEVERVPFTCTLDCGSRCALEAWVRDGEVVRIETPDGEPDTIERPRLVPCARGRALRPTLGQRERVRYPLRRTGPPASGSFERISWEQALDTVAGELRDVKDKWGTEAVLHAVGAGSVSGRGISGGSASRRFFSYWGPVTEASGNESNHCSQVAANWMLGGSVPGSDRATLLDSRLILMWGMNPAENRMGPNTEYFIAKARDAGARVVLIDPRYTASGVLADEWVPIRPGTDAALAAAMAFVLESEGQVDDFVHTHTVGYEAYRAYLLGEETGVARSPAWAEPITGVPAETTRRLAVELATQKPAALLPGWGPQRTRYGEQIARAWITLACMTGNVGVPGGGLASVGTRSGSLGMGRLPDGTYRPARRLPPGGWAGPVLDSTLGDAGSRWRKRPLKLAYIVASNVVNRSPDCARNARALASLGFVVVNEQVLTPTARYADIVLPICTDLERDDLVSSWGHDAHIFHSQGAVAPIGEARTDYWVFAQLAERLGFGWAYTRGREEAGWLDFLMEEAAGSVDVGELRQHGLMRADGEPRVALAAFRSDPERHPLPTSSGRVEIVCSEAELYGLPAIPSFVPAGGDGQDSGYPLQLVTPHHRLRSNSCLHSNPWLRDLDQHAVWIHPRDASSRGVVDGDEVMVSSGSGSVRVPAKVTERIRPGVVCLYQGTWYRPQDGVDVGGCANSLTAQNWSPTGGYATHSEWVDVEPVAAGEGTR